MTMGFLLVKLKILKADDGKSLSTLTLYLIMPCMILNAFQVDYTPDVKNGLFLTLAAALAMHLVLIIINFALKKILRMDAVEQVSVMYSNAGNLVIPLVSAMLGKEWVIYTSGFIVVQLILIWSHGKSVLCEEKSFSFKKVLLNINMIMIFIGVVLFFTGIRLPDLLQDTTATVGDMVGPVSMLVTGMLIGNMDIRKVFTYKRVWLVTFFRLIFVPLVMIALLKFSGAAQLVPNGEKILLITLLAATTPAASTITQLANVYGKDAEYATSINVVTTLLCIVTIPLMVTIYQL